MKARGAALQGALAVVGLCSAYATWQREPTLESSEAVVVNASLNDLEKVRYNDGKAWMEMERRADEGIVWLRMTGRTPTPRQVRGNQEAERLYKRFAPLEASRSLGALAEDKLKELGFIDAKRRLEVYVRGEKRSFQVALSPMGAGDPYIKDERDGRVYVFPNSTLNDLDSASVRLVDRRIHKFTADEFDGVSVSASGKRRDFVRLPSESKLVMNLAPQASPAKLDEQAKNWHDRVWHLVPLDIMGKDEEPASGKPEMVARIEYTFRGRQLGWIELARVVAKPPENATSATPPPVEAYVRSEFSAGWVRVTAGAEDLLKEAPKIAQGG